jgi:hypothetical protein
MLMISSRSPNMRYRLRTLLIAITLGPIVVAGIWCAAITPPLYNAPYFGPPPPAIRPGLNVAGLLILISLPIIVLGARWIVFGPRPKKSN